MRVYPIVVGRQTATPKQNFVVVAVAVAVVVSVVVLNGFFSLTVKQKDCAVIQ